MPVRPEEVGADGVAAGHALHGCPLDAALARFVGQMMAPDDASALARHLAACATCRQKAAALQTTVVEGGVAPSPAAVAAAGQRLGRFTLTRLLGRGGMGEVWAARDPELDREVAIKLLRFDLGGLDGGGYGPLRREAQAMARLTHPNIVRIYELGSGAGLLFCAMELVDGETLRQWLATPRPWRETLRVLVDAGRGVAAAHAAGVVHRDVKPDNVMIARDGRILVTDFGLARFTGVASDAMPVDAAVAVGSGAQVLLTRTGAFVGTPRYMPPEVIEARGGDAASDQFAFCVMAHEALYRSRPFVGSTIGELLQSIHDGPAAPPRRRSGPSRRVGRCLRRGLAFDKEARWPTMVALLSSLERAARPWRRRRVVIATAAATAALALPAALTLPGRSGPDEEALFRAAGESRMARSWSPARAARLRSAFARASEAGVPQKGEDAARGLDGYRAAWLAMRTDAWSATNVRHQQPARVMEERMRCLDLLAEELEAFASLAAEAKPGDMGRIADGVDHLTPVATCATEATITAKFPRAVDPESHPEVYRQFEVEDARLRAALLGKPPADLLKELSIAVAESERAGEPGLTAGRLRFLANAQEEAGEFAASVETDRRMIQVAARARRHDMVAQAWIDMMDTLGSKLNRTDEALALEPAARAALAQAGDQPDQRANLARALSSIATVKGDFAAAARGDQEAFDALVAAHGPRDTQVAITEVNLSMSLFNLEQDDEAVRHAQHAHEILSTAGARYDRPRALTLLVQAWIAQRRQDFAASARYAKDAVADLERLNGSDNIQLASARRQLGVALSELGRHEEALAQMKPAEQAFLNAGGPKRPEVIDIQIDLANVLERGHRFAEAEKVARGLLGVVRSESARARRKQENGVTLDLLAAAGTEVLARALSHRAPGRAVRLFDRAMPVVIKLPNRGLFDNVTALEAIARTGLATRRARWALAWFKRIPDAAAKLPALRHRLVAASRRRRR